jgi:hypothetical protein
MKAELKYKSVYLVCNSQMKPIRIYDCAEHLVSEQCELNNWNYTEMQLSIGDFTPYEINFAKI